LHLQDELIIHLNIKWIIIKQIIVEFSGIINLEGLSSHGFIPHCDQVPPGALWLCAIPSAQVPEEGRYANIPFTPVHK
jgi:hypothetical protein